ncbi:GntR family transcriptional regulator [Lacisediminihabitans changchengi]|uniref:GntR family transcriptional regulator n=1 Tax=Lacisediminihabitans changchengi TaxID=2787634 RepID=A0A934W3G6_9MICO|nr:GntR family transcriptional regulator [Lacisediminihabitans changchengi]MBK4348948.1 GntR family transcriptional regulator [Lacisediminihabitans changchengi]
MDTASSATEVQARANLKRHDVAAELRRAIVSGTYVSGALLPGENELAQHFSVSRGTIRRALGRLAADALIETRTGIGSFVIFDGVALGQTPSWGQELAASGLETTTEIVSIELVTDAALAAAMNTTDERFLSLVRRRRLTDGTAVTLERSRVPAVGPLGAAPTDGLIDDSLTATMAAAGLFPHHGDQWISTAALDPDDAALLDRSAGDLFLKSARVVRDAEDRFVENVVSWLHPEHFRLHTTFGGHR